MIYLCPNCKSIMVSETTMSIPSTTTYKCIDCGYKSKPVTEMLNCQTLPPWLWSDDTISDIVKNIPAVKKINSIIVNANLEDGKNYDVILDVNDCVADIHLDATKYPRCDMSFDIKNFKINAAQKSKENEDG